MKNNYLFIFVTILSIITIGCEVDNSIPEQNEVDILDKHSINAVASGMVSGDGITNDGPAIQALLNDPNYHTIRLEADNTFLIDVNNFSINIPSNKTLIIDGEVLIRDRYYANNNPFYDLFYANGVDNVKILGAGIINGNGEAIKNNPAYQGSRFALVRFENSTNIELSVKTIKNNVSRPDIPPTSTFCMIRFENCENINIHDLTVSNWIYEGICVKNSKNSNLNNINMFGSDLSYSGIQVGGGSLHTVNACYVKDSGTSGIGFDTKYSTISNCRVENNRRYNGFNFGHANSDGSGTPAENCYIVNCIAKTQYQTIATDNIAYYGFNFSSTSANNSIVNCQAIGYTGSKAAGFNLSSGSAYMSNIRANDCSNGLKLYYGDVTVNNADFSDNINAFFDVLETANYSFTNVRLSDDSFRINKNLIQSTNHGTYSSLIVNNGNIRRSSNIDLRAKSNTALNSYISSQGNGFLEVISNDPTPQGMIEIIIN